MSKFFGGRGAKPAEDLDDSLEGIQDRLVFRKDGPQVLLTEEMPEGHPPRVFLRRRIVEKTGTKALIKRNGRLVLLFNDLMPGSYCTAKQVIPLLTTLVPSTRSSPISRICCASPTPA